MPTGALSERWIGREYGGVKSYFLTLGTAATQLQTNVAM